MRLSIFNPQRWAESIHNLVDGWKAFWFTPADPLVLGVQRIGAGLVLIYLVLVTTPLLPSLYAPDALVDDQTANLFRLENPITLPPEEWEPPEGSTPPPVIDKDGRSNQKLPPVVRPERMNKPESLEYFKRWGIDPAFSYDEGMPQFSPFFHLHSVRWMQIVHGLGLVVAILFTLGLGTRVVSVLAWIYALSYIHRVMLATFGMDTMLAIALFYLMLGPAGARLSVDRLIQRFRRWRFALRHPGVMVSMEVMPSVSANVVLRLFQIHFCIIYINSGMSKLQGAAWWNGTALWQTLSNYEFTPVRTDLYTHALRALSQVRWLWETAMTSGDLFTIGLEIGLPFLIWFPRWRPVMLIGAAMLHTGIALTMGMTSFSLLMVILIAAFIPATVVHRWLDWLLQGSRMYTLIVNARRPGGVRLAALIKAVDVRDQVRIDRTARPVEEGEWPANLDGPRLVGAGGQTWRGYALFERLSRSLRLLWPVGLLTWIPGVAWIGRRLVPAEAGEKQPETAGVGS